MIKKVLVYTYGSQSHQSTIQTAALFAQQHEATLTGVFIRPAYIGFSAACSDYPYEQAQQFYLENEKYAETAEQEFKRVTEQLDCKSDWLEIDV